ncbi:hypothetical protein Patl1_00879 [Pistacia atlantica]|uniref:Uncharacterized protein n=1 Tax=Pistacia atlantica TaxID=434234 RepID=A0ACC1C6B6_9ROSI|nr:hypothetical protein Patl1_00879 [Pistacia atlantica]
MAEDQSVVGRRRIYYDQHGSEALICSDSEEDNVEPEEEKHEFTDAEDRIIWATTFGRIACFSKFSEQKQHYDRRMAFQEHGLGEEVVNLVGQFTGVATSEIQERYNILKEKYNDKNLKDSADSGFEMGISLDKTLSAALDSFDNLFCRRCLLFDCRLHGCSQTLIDPCEKQSYWSEYEDDRKPCSDHCYLQLRTVQDVLEGSTIDVSDRMKDTKEGTAVPPDAEEPGTDNDTDLILDGRSNSEKVSSVTSEAVHSSVVAIRALTTDTYAMQSLGKRKALQPTNVVLNELIQVSDDLQNSSSKKQKKLLPLDVITASSDAIASMDGDSGCHIGASSEGDLQMITKDSQSESIECGSEKFASSSSALHDKIELNIRGEAKDVKNEPELKQASSKVDVSEGVFSSSEWKPIEKELYSKGVEIFGRNSCLIARNLLSGLKTCIEVSSYMREGGSSMPHKSVAASSFLEENRKADSDCTEQEMPTRPRLLRRRGRTRKLKYSWKSAGHPSIWKRIADGKNQSCKQYTPCGCQSMCGKQCPCLHNGTCCEKYCGNRLGCIMPLMMKIHPRCSKSCKNRFRGCHCAKSQCRSRQCPCFAAGRECDPDVCRNCWVSCGDGSLGEPLKRGDGQCGNMRLLLRQQQRILLAKSDVAGWGAFLKPPHHYRLLLLDFWSLEILSLPFDSLQFVLDAYRKGDKLKFANHSSNPNCYAKVMLVAGDHRVGIFAKEHIEASEELFYDYRYGPDQAPVWARKPEGSKRDDSSVSQGRAKKHQSH